MASAATFDPQDRDSWYFGPLVREEANKALSQERENGVFLVRDSTTIKGDFVLCVKEENRNCHYIINKIMVSGMPRFRIGDQEFNDLPSLLAFYKTHYLDTTPLIRPVSMNLREKYLTKYDFAGKDPEDLPFKKGEILIILHKDEEQWWTARNDSGQSGQVPVNYLEKYEEQVTNDTSPRPMSHQNSSMINEVNVPNTQRNLPAKAVAIRDRTPNAFDHSALKLKVGDEVLVTAMNINGQWEGECNGKVGTFPFTHVKFLDDDDENDEQL